MTCSSGKKLKNNQEQENEAIHMRGGMDHISAVLQRL